MEGSGGTQEPLFQLGLIADVQYADANNGFNFQRTQERHYRHARVAMREAVGAFGACDYVLQLGDLLDGQCGPAAVAEPILKDLLADFKDAAPILSVLGNHELYCFPKHQAASLLGLSSWNYVIRPHAGWKIIVCDAYAVSTLVPEVAEQAFQLLDLHNPNNVRANQADWLAGLTGLSQRFVPYNGAMGQEQRAWLERELDCDDRVIVVSHVPVCPGAANDSCLLWDYEEVLDLLRLARAQVVLVLAGHDHDGGYRLDPDSGIPHLTLPSPMVCLNQGKSTAHGVLQVYHDRVELVGSGTVPTMTWRLN